MFTLLFILSDDERDRTLEIGSFPARKFINHAHLDDGAVVVHLTQLLFCGGLICRVNDQVIDRGACARLNFEAEFLHDLTITRQDVSTKHEQNPRDLVIAFLY